MKEKRKYWERSRTKGFNNLLGYADKGNCKGKEAVMKPVRLIKVNKKVQLPG